MLSLTRKTDYSLVALARLAEERVEGNPVSARQIAEAYDLPLAVLTNVLKDLQRAGIVASARGAHGGYTLAVPPEELTLTRVIDTIEGPMRMAMCCCGEEEADACTGCELAQKCPVTDQIHRINVWINQVLGQVTLAQLVERQVALPAGPLLSVGVT